MFKFVNKMKNRKGFTLIELIVVVAILGILALIAVPRFLGATENAKQSAHDSNVAMIESAAELALANGEDDTSVTGVAWLVSNDYLSNEPLVPLTITAAQNPNGDEITEDSSYALTVTKSTEPGDGGYTYTITVNPGKGDWDAE